jgi:hypothetical protein
MTLKENFNKRTKGLLICVLHFYLFLKVELDDVDDKQVIVAYPNLFPAHYKDQLPNHSIIEVFNLVKMV